MGQLLYKLADELRESDNDRVQSKHWIREYDQSDVNNQETEEMTTVPGKNHDESAKSPDFFQNNNATKKKFFSKP